jgi:integrase
VRNQGKLRALILDFYASADFTKLAKKTRRDYKRGLADVDRKWGDAPKAALESPELRGAVKKWIEKNWTDKEADHRLTPFKRVLSWAVDGGRLSANPLSRMPLYYENKGRAEIIWLPDEIEEFCSTAYDELSRAVRLEEALGLRIGDLVRLALPHIVRTPEGRRAVHMKTNKSGRRRQVQIPLTREAEEIVDSRPPGQLLILKPPRATSWTEDHLSKEVNDHLVSIGLKNGRDGRLLRLESRPGENVGLHFHDIRGSACTKLVRDGLSLKNLALHMGWKPSYAAKMLDLYLSLYPARADEMAVELKMPAPDSTKESKA